MSHLTRNTSSLPLPLTPCDINFSVTSCTLIIADKIDKTMFRIHFKEKYLPAEEIVITSTKKKWGLFHIAPDITSLEDIFVQLTQKEKV